jgi:ATP-dependent DNA helicase RecG
MSEENSTFDRKSLRLFTARRVDWDEMALDCVAFANANGGRILVGIEDNAEEPPEGQVIPEALGEQVQKRMAERTVNVQLVSRLQVAGNGGQVLEIAVARSTSVASTTDGRFYLRVADTCAPVTGDDVLRLASERSGRPWEAMDSGVPAGAASALEATHLLDRLRSSDRVKPSVKDKSDAELLVHYGLVLDGNLSRLGALVIGGAAGRRAIGTAPIVQAIRYDEEGNKVNKWSWDDYELSPIDFVDSIWKELPDFRESYEIVEGLFRRQVPAYDESVIRELLVNALVHRPYTQQGDIYLNLHPDRMVVVNPGRLPLGVTPSNLLRSSRRRNDGLARIFHDIVLMEREGSGYDLIYDRLLSQGRPVPQVVEGPDSVQVTIQRRILKPEALRLLEEADARLHLTQRERITLGLLAQSEGLNARGLAQALEAETTAEVASWLGRLPQFGLVLQTGRTSATRYFIPPDILRSAHLDQQTTLARIQPHRLQELVREDLSRYPASSTPDINRRIGPEIAPRTIKRALDVLVARQEVIYTGIKRWRLYSLASKSIMDKPRGSLGGFS